MPGGDSTLIGSSRHCPGHPQRRLAALTLTNLAVMPFQGRRNSESLGYRLLGSKPSGKRLNGTLKTGWGDTFFFGEESF
jgi:hypothetical protein